MNIGDKRIKSVLLSAGVVQESDHLIILGDLISFSFIHSYFLIVDQF